MGDMMNTGNDLRIDPTVKRFVDARRILEELVSDEAACAVRYAELQDPNGTLASASRPSERKAAKALLVEAQDKVSTQYAFVRAVYDTLSDTLMALVEPPHRSGSR